MDFQPPSLGNDCLDDDNHNLKRDVQLMNAKYYYEKTLQNIKDLSNCLGDNELSNEGFTPRFGWHVSKWYVEERLMLTFKISKSHF